ncbi:MAG: FHA domain-containing protein, partial [Wenzhouxiangellaceae bacterium]
MEVIVEQLGTTNNVLERQKFDQHRVELGRAFSNDVILTDEHVDAVHARLEFDEEGRLFIEDLDSVNGIRRPRHKAHIQRDEVHSGEVFLIGRSRVRIFVASHPVPPAVRIRLSEVFLLWLGKPQVAVALALIFMLTRVLGTWLTTLGEFRWSLVVERHFGETLMFLGLAIGVYFLSVLFRRGGNFLAHVSVLILLFLFSTVLELFLSLAEFNAANLP